MRQFISKMAWPAGLFYLLKEKTPRNGKIARPPGLLYAVNETPPAAVLVVAALQQVAVMASSLSYPIILGHEAGLSGAHMLDFISLSLLSLGIGTILLCANSRFIGSGYLCPAGYTQIYLGPSLFAVKIGGLASAFGMTIVAGFLQLAMAPLLQRMRALLPSEIAGLVIAIVGLSLAGLGLRYSLDINNPQGIQPTHIAIAAISLVTMIVLNVWTSGYTKMFCVLIGISVGYVASAAFGVLDLAPMLPDAGLPILRVPSVEHIAWHFDPTLLAPFAIVAVATTLRAMGDVSNAERLNDKDWIRPNFRALAGGVAANGLASMICGLFGTTGLNTYSSSVGLSGATGVTSRAVGYGVGVAFALLSFVPAAGIAIAGEPAPVLGASMFFSSAFVFISGLQMITARLLDARKTIVIGFSFAMAVMADVYHDVFTHVPPVLQPIFGNALVLGTLCAVLLNLIMRIGVRKRVSLRLEGQIDRNAVERFLTEQGAHWAARRDVVSRAIFGAVQVTEVIGEPSGGVEIEASFDEFNLDIRIRYAGAPLVIPERRPSPREIVASEDGERLLAGYLLRRSADRINCKASGHTAEVQLHYDH
jgi:NCS2 family nucleobase:cation symporter-2